METAPKIEINLKEKYRAKADSDGFVKIADFSTIELKKQAKNVSEFLDNKEDCFLGEGLNFKGDLGNYDMKIHIDNLDEFVRRIKKYYGN